MRIATPTATAPHHTQPSLPPPRCNEGFTTICPFDVLPNHKAHLNKRVHVTRELLGRRGAGLWAQKGDCLILGVHAVAVVVQVWPSHV